MNGLSELYQELLASGKYTPAEIPGEIAKLASQSATLKRRLLNNGYPQSYIDSLSMSELFNSSQNALPLATGSAELDREQSARVDAENALNNRNSAARELDVLLRQADQDKIAAEKDPFRLAEHLRNLMSTKSGNPLQELLGAGTYIDPKYEPDPRIAELERTIQDYAQPKTFTSEKRDDPNIAAVRAAYQKDPAAAAIFFKQDPENLRRMFGAAGGASFTLKEPIIGVGAHSGKKLFTAAENGDEDMDVGDGIQFRPLPGVSQSLKPKKQRQIIDMAEQNGAFEMDHFAAGGTSENAFQNVQAENARMPYRKDPAYLADAKIERDAGAAMEARYVPPASRVRRPWTAQAGQMASWMRRQPEFAGMMAARGRIIAAGRQNAALMRGGGMGLERYPYGAQLPAYTKGTGAPIVDPVTIQPHASGGGLKFSDKSKAKIGGGTSSKSGGASSTSVKPGGASSTSEKPFVYGQGTDEQNRAFAAAFGSPDTYRGGATGGGGGGGAMAQQFERFAVRGEGGKRVNTDNAVIRIGSDGVMRIDENADPSQQGSVVYYVENGRTYERPATQSDFDRYQAQNTQYLFDRMGKTAAPGTAADRGDREMASLMGEYGYNFNNYPRKGQSYPVTVMGEGGPFETILSPGRGVRGADGVYQRYVEPDRQTRWSSYESGRSNVKPTDNAPRLFRGLSRAGVRGAADGASFQIQSNAAGGAVSLREATARAVGSSLQGNPFAHPDMVNALLAGRAPLPSSVTKRFRENVDPMILSSLMNSVFPAFGVKGESVLREARTFDPRGVSGYISVKR